MLGGVKPNATTCLERSINGLVMMDGQDGKRKPQLTECGSETRKQPTSLFQSTKKKKKKKSRQFVSIEHRKIC